MKKSKLLFFIMALVCVAIFAFAGCNSTPDNGTPDNSNNNSPQNDTEKDYCIVYFSYSGNTKRVANEIISQVNGVGIEIVPAIPYRAEDTSYDSNSRSHVELTTDARPEISEQTYSQIDLTEYETVIIGYPIWNGNEPMIIRTFIEHYNGLSGKTVYTFSTASSSSGDTAHDSIKSRCPNAEVKDNLHFTSATLSNMQTLISEWLENIKLENNMSSNKINASEIWERYDKDPKKYEPVYYGEHILATGVITYIGRDTHGTPSMELADVKDGKSYVLGVFGSYDEMSVVKVGDTVTISGDFHIMSEEDKVVLKRCKIENILR